MDRCAYLDQLFDNGFDADIDKIHEYMLLSCIILCHQVINTFSAIFKFELRVWYLQLDVSLKFPLEWWWSLKRYEFTVGRRYLRAAA